MASLQEIIDNLVKRFEDSPIPSGIDFEVATSKAFIDHILPALIPIGALIADVLTEVHAKRDNNTDTFFRSWVVEEPGGVEQAQISLEEQFEIAQKSGAEALFRFYTETAPWKHILNIVKTGATVLASIAGEANAIKEKGFQLANSDVRPAILDVETLIDMWYKTPSVRAEVTDTFAKHGLNDTDISRFVDLKENVFGFGEIFKLFFREEIPEGQAKLRLNKIRYNDNDFEKLKIVATTFPSVQDEIQFAVKEAYDDSFADTFGADNDFPQEFGEALKKLGYTSKGAALFWRQHWGLFSPQTMVEMWHREAINEEELDKGLKANDILPFFREAFKKITFSLFTRVDIRRLYEIGEKNEDEVIAHHKKIGYDAEDSLSLTALVLDQYSPNDKELSKSEVLNLFKHKEFTREQTSQALQAINFNADVAENVILSFELKELDKKRTKKRSYLKKAYVQRLLIDEDIRAELIDLGYNIEYVQDIFDDWNIDRLLALKQLSIGQLEKALKKGVIDINQVANYLLKLNYIEPEVSILLDLWRLGD